MVFDPTVTSPERTGWRDAEISLRHRHWGFDCPAADLDFLMVEYNLGLPVAVVEYKRYTAKRPDLVHPTYRALRKLAGNLPFYLAYYWPDIWAFLVYPVNDSAFIWFTDGEALHERAYVERLYAMRQRTVEEKVLVGLHTSLPGWDVDAEEWDEIEAVDQQIGLFDISPGNGAVSDADEFAF